MSLILSGTDGLSDVDGSAGTPAIRGTDANTGMFFPAADTIAFSEGGVESMRINSSGNVGIGTSSPSYKLQVSGGAVRLNAQVEALSAPAFTTSNSGSNSSQIWLTRSSTQHQGISFRGAVANDYGIYNKASDDGIYFGYWGGGGSWTDTMYLSTGANVGIGINSPTAKLHVYGGSNNQFKVESSGAEANFTLAGTSYGQINNSVGDLYITTDAASTNLIFRTASTERMRIDGSGNVLVGKTTSAITTQGCSFGSYGAELARDSGQPLSVNRRVDDGTVVSIRQGDVEEGTISVSGSTVSYNGGHLSRWSQLSDGSKDETIVKGTVMSNLDDMCVWEKDGVVAENEQLNKMKVSDVEGDTNVAGVFVNWTIDADYGVDDMNVAMTGDMIIRIADGVVVAKGDLLMSAGDGTAKPQGDDIVRSKTIAKVTSNYVTCTYADGSYCVPCVLMAC